MAAVTSSNGPSSPTLVDSTLNENKIVFALDQLQNMHIQLRHLRETMPQLVDPLLTPHSSPEELYSIYSRNALETAKAIKSFAKFIQEPASQETLRKAKESKAANPEGITPWIVTDHPDWLEVRKLGTDGATTTKEEGLPNGEAIAFPTVEEVSAAVESFRTKHPSVQINQRIGDSSAIEIYLPPPAHVHFLLKLDFEQSTYNATCKQRTKIHEAIANAVGPRLNPNSIDNVLELLASYTDIRSRPCASCGRLFDRDARFPYVRMKNSADSQWQAQHDSCR